MNYADFGHKIRLLRRERRMTMEQLAAQAGISASFLGNIERGTREISLDTLLALCRTLDVTPNDLLYAETILPQQKLPIQLTKTEQRHLNEIVALYLKHIRE